MFYGGYGCGYPYGGAAGYGYGGASILWIILIVFIILFFFRDGFCRPGC